jgi:hypothetical protein
MGWHSRSCAALKEQRLCQAVTCWPSSYPAVSPPPPCLSPAAGWTPRQSPPTPGMRRRRSPAPPPGPRPPPPLPSAPSSPPGPRPASSDAPASQPVTALPNSIVLHPTHCAQGRLPAALIVRRTCLAPRCLPPDCPFPSPVLYFALLHTPTMLQQFALLVNAMRVATHRHAFPRCCPPFLYHLLPQLPPAGLPGMAPKRIKAGAAAVDPTAVLLPRLRAAHCCTAPAAGCNRRLPPGLSRVLLSQRFRS